MIKDVPYIVYEGTMARFERTIRRLWILIIILSVFLVSSNVAWLMYESQYEDVTTTEQTVKQVASGEEANNTFVGGNYGESKSDNNDNDYEKASAKDRW